MTETAKTESVAWRGFKEARREILAGRCMAQHLWVILSDEHERDRFALKPMPWEGPGQYQHVHYLDGRDGFVRVPSTGLKRDSLPDASVQARLDWHKVVASHLAKTAAKPPHHGSETQ